MLRLIIGCVKTTQVAALHLNLYTDNKQKNEKKQKMGDIRQQTVPRYVKIKNLCQEHHDPHQKARTFFDTMIYRWWLKQLFLL